jgi:hypothetical protein
MARPQYGGKFGVRSLQPITPSGPFRVRVRLMISGSSTLNNTTTCTIEILLCGKRASSSKLIAQQYVSFLSFISCYTTMFSPLPPPLLGPGNGFRFPCGYSLVGRLTQASVSRQPLCNSTRCIYLPSSLPVMWSLTNVVGRHAPSNIYIHYASCSYGCS